MTKQPSIEEYMTKVASIISRLDSDVLVLTEVEKSMLDVKEDQGIPDRDD